MTERLTSTEAINRLEAIRDKIDALHNEAKALHAACMADLHMPETAARIREVTTGTIVLLRCATSELDAELSDFSPGDESAQITDAPAEDVMERARKSFGIGEGNRRGD